MCASGNINEAENCNDHHENPSRIPPPLACASQNAKPGPTDLVSVQKTTGSPFIQHLLEGLLASATSRSRRPSDLHEFSVSKLGAPSLPHHSKDMPAAKAAEMCEPTTEKGIETPSQTPDSPSSDTDSSDSDSDNDTKLLATVCDESDTEQGKDASLRTKHEKDENNVNISRPDFVATGQHTLVKVGTISSIMDNAIVVTTFNLAEVPPRLPNPDITNATALDSGSLLCLSDGTFLGAVFDTFGPVASPLYVVRFNNSEEIPPAAQVGQEVMYVEQEMSVVRARDVCRKGYDASGKDDEEVDADDFSDDEKERRAKKLKRSGPANRPGGPPKRKRGSRERHRQGGPERTPLHAQVEFHRSTRFRYGDNERQENERHRVSRNPHGSNQPSMEGSRADGFMPSRAHVPMQHQHPSAPPQPNFMNRGPGNMAHGPAFMPAPYPSDIPASTPSATGAHYPSFNAATTNTGYPGSLQRSPFSAPIAPFSNPMMAMQHQSVGYTQFWSPHAHYNQYGQTLGLAPTQQQPFHAVDQSGRLYPAGPSHSYHGYEHRPPGAMTMNRRRDPQRRDSAPNPDGGYWQTEPRQHNHM